MVNNNNEVNVEPIPWNNDGNLGASGWIRTNDLELMGLTSYRTALRRNELFCISGLQPEPPA